MSRTVAVIGLGNMGLGMARNLAAKGFATRGHARRESVRASLSGSGIDASLSVVEAVRGSDVVFLMVMDGAQVLDLLCPEVLDAFSPGAALVVSATVGQVVVRQVAERLEGRAVDLIDCPVSGGKGGADAGTLTLMVATPAAVLARHRAALEAISANIVHVGEQPGQGQVVKACLQAMIGTVFEALFEAMVLGAKAGVDLERLAAVINNSFVTSKLTQATTGHILERRFTNGGSHIATMHKDLGLSLDLAREVGVAMPATSVAAQMFQAGRSAIPDGDNWCIVQLLEQMSAARVEKKARSGS